MPQIPLDVQPLPDNWTPLSMFAVVKCLDEDGDVAFTTHATNDLLSFEAAGMVLAALDTLRDDMKMSFERNV
jgi:hypothetical protein